MRAPFPVRAHRAGGAGTAGAQACTPAFRHRAGAGSPKLPQPAPDSLPQSSKGLTFFTFLDSGNTKTTSPPETLCCHSKPHTAWPRASSSYKILGKCRKSSTGSDRKQDHICHELCVSSICSGEGQQAAETSSWEMFPFHIAGRQKDKCSK